ncbi:MAG: GNAT family N-acetyltransferase, partial [Actinomycetota bacterium]|nr:GNAT family N-acetyltransferase [Actinomycetota bacterium]
MTVTEPALCVVPTDEASWDDLQKVFGTRGAAARCQCQRYKLRPRESGTTSGLVAYLDSEPVGWCSV